MPGFDLPLGELAVFAGAIAVSGVISGLLAGMFGIGGGAVLVPVFYQVYTMLGVEEAVRMHVAVGSSLAIIVPTSISSFLNHRARGAVDMELLRGFMVAVPLGVVLASLTAAYISSAGLRAIFACVTLMVGLRLILGRESWRLGADIPSQPARGVVGLVIGYLSTLIGVGGGILNNTFMTLFGRPMHQAVATSSGVGVMIAIPGTVGYVWAGWGAAGLPIGSTGYINWITVALTIPLAILVTPLGVRLAHWLSRRWLEFGFGLFCLLVSARFFQSLL